MSVTTNNTHQKKESPVVSPSEFNASKVHITDIRKKKLGGKTSYNALLLHNGQPLLLETPWVRAPFGAGEYRYNGDASADPKYSVTVSASGRTSDDPEVVNHFFEQMRELNSKMVQYGVNNSKSGVFGDIKNSNEAVLNALVESKYKSFLREDETGQYPVQLKTTLPKARDEDGNVLNDVPDFDVFDFNSNSSSPCEIETFDDLICSSNTDEGKNGCITKGAYVRLILQPRLWFISGNFGLTWNVRSLEYDVKEKVEVRGKYLFSRPEEFTEETTEETTETVEEEVEDSEAESGEEEEVEESEEEEEVEESD
jgi:hypothetical protein